MSALFHRFNMTRPGRLNPEPRDSASIVAGPNAVMLAGETLLFKQAVGERGLEPLRPFGHWHLKPARLPFRHSPEWTPRDYRGSTPSHRTGPVDSLSPWQSCVALRGHPLVGR